MTSEKIVNSTSMELYYQTSDSILVARFHGFLKPGDAAKDTLVLLQTIQQRKVRLILVNQRDIKVLSREMQSFIAGNASEMVKNGVKKIAVVLPKDVFALAGVSKIHSELKTPGIEVIQFATEEEGLNWLRRSE